MSLTLFHDKFQVRIFENSICENHFRTKENDEGGYNGVLIELESNL